LPNHRHDELCRAFELVFSQKVVVVAPDESDPTGEDPMMPCGFFFRARYSQGGIGSSPAQSPERSARAST
jgi:hypothetical protein